MSNLGDMVKQELVAVVPSKPSARVAEIATMLRCVGETHSVGGQPVQLTATFEDQSVAERLVEMMYEAFTLRATLSDPTVQEQRKTPRYSVVLDRHVDDFLRKVGLRSPRGFWTRGLPPRVVNGQVEDHEAAWRGAFLAAGTLAAPGRTAGIEISSPCEEVSIALLGAARRLGIAAKHRPIRGVEKVTVRDPQAVAVLLTRMGAHESRHHWDMQSERAQAPAVEHRLANFDDANLRRSARAARQAALRIERALEILGDDIPEQLTQAGLLRLQHKEASLEELGRLSEPPLTKDAIAGRIRRLLQHADKRASELGIADTNAALD